MSDEIDEQIAAALTAGGWCAPMETLNDLRSEPLELPKVSVARGGISYEDTRTDAEKIAEASIQSLILRKIGNIIEAQDAALEVACHIALANDWNIHVYRNYSSRFIGIEFSDDMRLPFPTIFEHSASPWCQKED